MTFDEYMNSIDPDNRINTAELHRLLDTWEAGRKAERDKWERGDPGTPGGYLLALFQFAEKECGHVPFSAKHALTTVMEWITKTKVEMQSLKNRQSRSFGFDMQGPDTGVDWSGRNGYACTCHWSSSHHGDECPEHGKKGVQIPDELTELRTRCDQLEAALKPFADYANHFPAHSWDMETVLMEVTNAPNITLGDCRRATELLKPTTATQAKVE